MKKHNTLRIAALLLVLVMVTTCAVSGTFAKYVTTGTSSDSARVAKWGVTVTAAGNAFADNYDTDDSNVKGTITKSVVTSGTTGDAVVAPGTSGTFTTSTITGTPEVAVAITYDATVTITGDWISDAAGTFYFPLVVKVGDDAVSLAEGTTASATTWAAAIKSAIEAKAAKYTANTDLSAHDQEDLAVTWEWAFEGAEGTDAKDTYLGNVAAGLVTGKTAPSISIQVITTVTQIN